MKSKEELIQDFVEDRLSEEDKPLFDQYWNTDPAFKEQLELQQEIYNILEYRSTSGAEGLREKLSEVETAFRSGARKRTSIVRKLIPIWAAACVLILAMLFLLPRTENLYELPQMRSEIVRGQSDQEPASQRYEAAVSAFNQGQYAESTNLLRDLQRENPNILQYGYYLGISLIGEKNFGEAENQLAGLASGESVYKNEAIYYLAVALYEQGKMGDALVQANLVPQTSSVYPQAQKLIQVLNREKETQ